MGIENVYFRVGLNARKAKIRKKNTVLKQKQNVYIINFEIFIG